MEQIRQSYVFFFFKVSLCVKLTTFKKTRHVNSILIF